MNCAVVQERLCEFIDKRLDVETSANVESHLASCANCRSDAEDLTSTVRLLAGEPEFEPPMAFSTRVMAHVREEAVKPSLWQRFFGSFRAFVPIQAMAVAVIAVLAVFLYQKEHSVEPVQQLAKSANPPGAHDTPAQLATPAPESSAIAGAARKADGAAPRSEVRGFAQSAPALTAPGSSEQQRALQPAPPASATRSHEPATHHELSVRLLLTLRSGKSPALSGDWVLSRADRERLDQAQQKALETNQPQSIFLSVSRGGYDQLKKELSAIGVIEADIGQNIGNPAESLRIKITLLPPTAGTQ